MVDHMDAFLPAPESSLFQRRTAAKSSSSSYFEKLARLPEKVSTPCCCVWGGSSGLIGFNGGNGHIKYLSLNGVERKCCERNALTFD